MARHAWLLVVLLAAGCWLDKPAPAVLPVHDDEPLSVDPRELVALADRQSTYDTSREKLIEAVNALEKARRLVTERPGTLALFEVEWRLARAAFLVAEDTREANERLAWRLKGEDAAEAAQRERPDRVEGYYYDAGLKGRRAEQGGFGGIVLAGTVRKLGEKAAELDPHFEEAGAERLLGMLFAKAPPWPTSFGDIDTALEHARRAVALSDYPLNHLMLAEVLHESGDAAAARIEIERVLSAPKVGRWATEGERWRAYARQLLRRIEANEH